MSDSKTIWKYGLAVIDEQTIEMPEGAKILSVGAVNDNLFIWALVDPYQKLEERILCVHGTGHPIQVTDEEFIDTVLTYNGQLVWHIFDISLRGKSSHELQIQ